MGWTFLYSLNGKTSKDYLDETLTWENEGVKARPLKSAKVGSVYYAAVESVSKPEGKRQVWAAVVLTKSCPRAKDGLVFGYKDMCEDMGPVASKCPAGILDLLTETDSEYARNWRERCRAYTKTKRSGKPPAPGSRLKFAEPIPFVDGTRHTEFTVVQYSRRGRMRTVYRAANGGLYRIPKISERQFEVVAVSEPAN
ncbi:DUF6927 domain-containing protein [Asticcacaulis excentricus]|uniref:DUF6927 domain-containing protein n=1 Tax=Asticcacaulis excentricus (strain ATCC 15261 / DSM 4724 / KCTC 12464 / NCIMB 9791 / VKM B-1370 / CB 48) TaxID=573065 RepID=E8RVV2_ASTEC|nr:hypothetical protein [Asticcacaulis excentricus]ADU15374.1 hypothetical protein Astex_3763 [Asticcacaulis excentricus CB 48]